MVGGADHDYTLDYDSEQGRAQAEEDRSMTPIERCTQAAWDELERQGQVNASDTPYVDREALLIDGHVDLPAIVSAVLQAIREPSEAMTSSAECADLTVSRGGEDSFDYLSKENAADVWRKMIDTALAE